MPNFRVRAAVDYNAWPETTHAARVIRQQARSTIVGHNHVLAAALVFTAFSVEAFVQTLGPRAYGEDWLSGKRPAERFPIKVKLKCIGKKWGVPVSYGVAPWSTVAALITARDALAHPKSDLQHVDLIIDAIDGDEALKLGVNEAYRSMNPLRDIDALDGAADQIERALLKIWVASGESAHALKVWNCSHWNVSPA